jgi:hypothetical protein
MAAENATGTPGSTFDINPCTDKDWRETCPHLIDVIGWDGGGSMSVEVPMTDDDLDELVVLLQKYRQQHPRPVGQKELASEPEKAETP